MVMTPALFDLPEPARRPGQRPRLLDLFCCAGGAATGYHRAGFDVVGVDIAPQPNYPFEFHRADALEFVAEHGSRFDAIHASPPCQGYLNLGAVNRTLGREYNHPDLIAATRELLVRTGLPYVIENVEDARPHLISPVRICGTGLNQPLRRHRLFESNVPLIGVACAHDRFTEPKYWTGWRPNGERRLSTVVQVYGNGGGREHWAPAMGMDWATDKEMAAAVPPSYTRHLGRQLLRLAQEEPEVHAKYLAMQLDGQKFKGDQPKEYEKYTDTTPGRVFELLDES
ncbi:DNA methylase [Nocardia sp. GCM10030253]|uniref:DNA methylase n=1 Tax=Nocardia sp. GCM10030253 TaxID=3273404 RepID=UPI0036324CAC